MGLPVIGLAVRGVTNGIGLAHEAMAARKKNKLAKANSNDTGEESPASVEASTLPETPAAGGQSPAKYDQSAVQETDLDSDAEDEEAWALDDAETALLDDENKVEEPKAKLGYDAQESVASMTTRIIANCPPPPSPPHRLDQLVILPERRPGDRKRGFVRAYAPVLSASGIDEKTFLAFLDIFGKATHSSPILKVVQVGASIAGFVPEPTTQIVSTVVGVAVGAAQEVQSRQRTASFMDEINERLFEPRGLYALIMSYKAEQKTAVEVATLDFNELVAKRQKSNSHTVKGALKLGAGTTHGALELPPAAPLKYPELDEAVMGGDAEKAAKVKVAGAFLNDYFDRRAQATYVSSP